MSFVFVALGGALGAVTRYAISLIPVKTQFLFCGDASNSLIADVFPRNIPTGSKLK